MMAKKTASKPAEPPQVSALERLAPLLAEADLAALLA